MQAVQWWQKAPPRQCEIPTLSISPNEPAPVGWEPYLRTLKSALTSPPPRPRKRPCASLGAATQEDRMVGHAQTHLVKENLAPPKEKPLLGYTRVYVAAAQRDSVRVGKGGFG